MSKPTKSIFASPQRTSTPDDHEIRRKLARAVMDPSDRRVMLIEEDNSDDGWMPLDAAIASGRPYSAVLRDDVIAFDGDDDDSDQRALLLAAEMEAAGVFPVVWLSGRPGHAQIDGVCSSPSERERWRERGAELGFQYKRRTRPPLSPHRHGLPVRLLYPKVPFEAIERLSVGLGNYRSGDLTPRTMRRLVQGDPDADSGSEVVLQIAMGAVAKGVSFEKFKAMLANPKHKGGEAYQRRLAKNPKQAEKWLSSFVWPRAQQYVGDNKPITDATDTREHLDAMREEVAAFGWVPVLAARKDEVGRQVVEKVRPTSLRRGLEGILDLAWKQGSIHVALSQRILVKATGLSAPTVRKVLDALIRQRWITEVHPHTASWAGIYRVNLTGPRIPNPPLADPVLRLIHGQKEQHLPTPTLPLRGAYQVGGKP